MTHARFGPSAVNGRVGQWAGPRKDRTDAASVIQDASASSTQVSGGHVASRGLVFLVGSGTMFSRVLLRTIETELDGTRAERIPDVSALTLLLAHSDTPEQAWSEQTWMVISDEDNAPDLLTALATDNVLCPRAQIAIAYENDANAANLYLQWQDLLLNRRISLMPMNTNLTRWVNVLRLIHSGGHYLPPEILRSAGQPQPDGAAFMSKAPSAMPFDPSDRLTPRENEVLKLAANGYQNKTIADRLNLSEHTVKLHMHRVIAKLGVHNRTGAAVWYHRNLDG